MQPAIQAQDVTRAHGPRRALHRVTFTLTRGSTTLLVGPNGSGKTTLLRLLATLDAPTSGTLRVHGLDPTRDGPTLRTHLGFLGHRNGLPHALTPHEVLTFHARLHRMPDADAAATRGLEDADLLQRADTPCAHLSHGQRRRLALARSLLHDPDVLLLDEPLAGLDPGSRERTLVLLQEAQRTHRTVLLATHDPDRVTHLTTKRLRLREGELVGPDPHPDPEATPP